MNEPCAVEPEVEIRVEAVEAEDVDNDKDVDPVAELLTEELNRTLRRFFHDRGHKFVFECDDAMCGYLAAILKAVDGQHGDPGKLYPLHERVERVIGALKARVRR